MTPNTGIPLLNINGDENQLELFRFLDPRSIENQIKRLEGEINTAIRLGDFRLAANLTQEQKRVIQNQIGPLL